MARVAPLALSLLLFAGCVTPASDTDPDTASTTVPAGWWENAVPSTLTDPDHDHAVRAQHANLTTSNFEVLGWDPLVTEHYGTTLTGMGCGGAFTRDDGTRLAIVHSISTDVSFVVADVTDPMAPKMLGEFFMPNAVVWDADISADGMHVLVGAYPYVFSGDTLPELPVGGAGMLPAINAPLKILYRDACTGIQTDLTDAVNADEPASSSAPSRAAGGPEAYLPYGPGIVMVSIADPTAPALEDWVPQPAVGPHSVGSQAIDGKIYATSSVTNLQHEGSYYSIFEIVGPKLVPYSVIQTPGVYGEPLTNGHTDVFLQTHPVTGQLLAHLANWDGYYIVDLSTPGVPMVISEWFDAGNVHTTFPFPTLIDDKVYIAVGQEVGEPVDLPSGWIYILDITDPAAPTEVGRWTLPVKPKWDDGGLQFSPHYVAIQNDTMFVSNYHGGLWAVDISDLRQPLASGIFVPDRESTANYGGEESYGPGVEDVIYDPVTGILTTWDGAGGVYQLRFTDDPTSPRAPAWPGSEPASG